MKADKLVGVMSDNARSPRQWIKHHLTGLLRILPPPEPCGITFLTRDTTWFTPQPHQISILSKLAFFLAPFPPSASRSFTQQTNIYSCTWPLTRFLIWQTITKAPHYLSSQNLSQACRLKHKCASLNTKKNFIQVSSELVSTVIFQVHADDSWPWRCQKCTSPHPPCQQASNNKKIIGLLRAANTAWYLHPEKVVLDSLRSSYTTFPGCKYHAVFAAQQTNICLILSIVNM